MSDQNDNKNQLAANIMKHLTIENFSKLVLGTKKTGQQRAIYDVVKDYTVDKKKKKKKGKGGKPDSVYSLLAVKSKKKKKKKKKHWRL